MKALPAPLTDPWFEARFSFRTSESGWWDEMEGGKPVDFANAQGLQMWCPCGYGAVDKDGNEAFPIDLSHNKGRPHAILVPFANPPSGIPVHPDHGPTASDGKTHVRWQVSGTALNDLTVSPSIAVGNPQCWHGFIQAEIVK